MLLHRWSGWLLALCALAACTPELNWREVRTADSGAVAMFPCKPDRYARSVLLAGVRVQMSLASCEAGGATYALMHADVGDPAKVGDALAELRAAMAGNLGAAAAVLSELKISGMTPNPQAQRLAIDGQRPDGSTMRMQAGLFVKGTRVFQASIVGERLDAEAADTFFAGLQVPG